ncbi:MAG: hypothetical protein P8130_01025 [Deltaproteobacteria bacterium]
MTSYGKDLKNKIDNVAQLSSICRSEWCRSLESRVDTLREEVETLRSGRSDITGAELSSMLKSLQEAYRHLGPDIHV